MKIVAACEDSGSLKEIVCIKGTDTSSQAAPQPDSIQTHAEDGLRSRPQRLVVVSTAKGSVAVAARANGYLSFYKTENYDLINTITDCLVTDSKDKDQFVALIESFGVLYAASEQGLVTIVDINTIHNDKITSTHTRLKAPVSAFASHPEQEGIFAYGGKENDARIVRLFNKGELSYKDDIKPTQLFQAKNVKNDKLDLRVPIWITSILFVRLSQHTESSWHFITSTRYGQVRRYDTSHGRKPVMDKKLSEKPLVQVVQTNNEEEIICADTHNTTGLYSVDKGTLLAKYKGSVGAVQGMFAHLSGEKSLLVTGALDRYVRVFDIDTREQIAKVFVGGKVSAVWLLDDDMGKLPEAPLDGKAEKKKKAKKARDALEKEDADLVWNELDQMEKSVKKRKTEA
ncbi:CYFA0S09e03664g1_1 [Cyberlindnera fabianii]|uniref:Ribosome biogenesis protein NSA1 n=1 Tax=Cyberlindnera fabianii TaxID=36022 RepID=A0A061AY10_CYBFA|nr:CYFA0S09e03664g1_1 [Cyberlindnera fabianii]